MVSYARPKPILKNLLIMAINTAVIYFILQAPFLDTMIKVGGDICERWPGLMFSHLQPAVQTCDCKLGDRSGHTTRQHGFAAEPCQHAVPAGVSSVTYRCKA